MNARPRARPRARHRRILRPTPRSRGSQAQAQEAQPKQVPRASQGNAKRHQEPQQSPKEAPRGTERRPSWPSKSQEAPKEAPRATKRPTRWAKKVPREPQEASRAETIAKTTILSTFFMKPLKPTMLSAFSSTGRAVGAQPWATKRCNKRTRS